MSLNFLDVQSEYNKDKQLKPNDVKALMDWANCQPHLPQITELQAILFLHSCDYSNEQAKGTIDKFFTVRTMCPELFRDRNPLKEPLKYSLHLSLSVISPKKTPEGYLVIYVKFVDLNPEAFDFPLAIRGFDMVIMSSLYQEHGTTEGFRIVFDTKGMTLRHVTKINPFMMKKFLYYTQEALPIKLKGFHFINIVPAATKVAMLMKSFLGKDFANMIYLHKDIGAAAEFIPMDCMSVDYGGRVESLTELHAKCKEKLYKNNALFEWEDGQIVDESKRPGKAKTASEIFGVEGTFKQLDIN